MRLQLKAEQRAHRGEAADLTDAVNQSCWPSSPTRTTGCA
jgi:hypothetical protein